MKLLTSLTLSIFATVSLSAQTTMCFKENHKSMATIENTKLDGGECKGLYSVKEMQKAGWNTDDIKITSTPNGHNYIYIFKKNEIKTSSIDEAALETKILQRLEQRKKEEIEVKKREIYVRKSRSGEKIYKNKCANCHGEKGDKIYGTSRAISELDLTDFSLTMRDYGLGTYDRGQALIMRPYQLNSQDTKNVYIYLKSLKSQKKEVSK